MHWSLYAHTSHYACKMSLSLCTRIISLLFWAPWILLLSWVVRWFAKSFSCQTQLQLRLSLSFDNVFWIGNFLGPKIFLDSTFLTRLKCWHLPIEYFYLGIECGPAQSYLSIIIYKENPAIMIEAFKFSCMVNTPL